MCSVDICNDDFTDFCEYQYSAITVQNNAIWHKWGFGTVLHIWIVQRSWICSHAMLYRVVDKCYNTTSWVKFWSHWTDAERLSGNFNRLYSEYHITFLCAITQSIQYRKAQIGYRTTYVFTFVYKIYIMPFQNSNME